MNYQKFSYRQQTIFPFPMRLIQSNLDLYLNQVNKSKAKDPSWDDDAVARIVLPFRGQQSANVLRKQVVT